MSTSYSSDQTTLLMDTIGSDTLSRAGRARITSIQGKGIASSVLKLHDVAVAANAAAGNLVATYKFGTEGLDIYVPGSGILFEEGVYLDLTATPGVTITFT